MHWFIHPLRKHRATDGFRVYFPSAQVYDLRTDVFGQFPERRTPYAETGLVHRTYHDAGAFFVVLMIAHIGSGTELRTRSAISFAPSKLSHSG